MNEHREASSFSDSSLRLSLAFIWLRNVEDFVSARVVERVALVKICGVFFRRVWLELGLSIDSIAINQLDDVKRCDEAKCQSTGYPRRQHAQSETASADAKVRAVP